jgi:hypothetical protein
MVEELKATIGSEAPYSSHGAKDHRDIVQKIKDLYLARRSNVEQEQLLVPTKASLFGLDIRFR